MTYTEKHRAIGRAAFLMGEARDAKHGVRAALYVHAYAEKVQAAYDAGYNGAPQACADTPHTDRVREDLFA